MNMELLKIKSIYSSQSGYIYISADIHCHNVISVFEHHIYFENYDDLFIRQSDHITRN